MGYPFIEAAQHRLSILVREIPVFREVAGDHATYFLGPDAVDLASAVRAGLVPHASRNIPDTTAMPWQTWGQIAGNIMECMSLVSDLRSLEH